MSFSIRKEINELFAELQKYAIFDLELMLEKADYESNYGRLAVPIALTTFSVLDVVGFLIRDFDSSILSREETKYNLQASFRYFYPGTINTNNFGMVIDLYRNGTNHLFFPKGVGIHNTKFGSNIIESDGERYNFNVHPFASILISSMENYEIIIQNNWANLEKNYPLYKARIRKDFDGNIKNLPKSSSKIVEMPTTTLQNP